MVEADGCPLQTFQPLAQLLHPFAEALECVLPDSIKPAQGQVVIGAELAVSAGADDIEARVIIDELKAIRLAPGVGEG